MTESIITALFTAILTAGINYGMMKVNIDWIKKILEDHEIRLRNGGH